MQRCLQRYVRKAVEPVAALREKPALDEGTQPLNSDMYDDDYELTTSVAFLTSRRKRGLRHSRVLTRAQMDQMDDFSGGKLEGVSPMFDLPSGAKSCESPGSCRL